MSIGYSIKTICDEYGKQGYDYPCLTMPNGEYKLLCETCRNKITVVSHYKRRINEGMK